MKKILSVFLLASAIILSTVACGSKNKEPAIPEQITEDSAVNPETDTAAPSESQPQESGTAVFDWIPDGIQQIKAETAPNEELRKLIIDYYEIPEDDLESSRYYYNYVDLNNDGKDEILAVVVGMYTSGSGGSSAIWCETQDDVLTVKQSFTLVNVPIIVAPEEGTDTKQLILTRSGGGAETEYVALTCKDGIYNNVSDAEAVDISSVQGIAVLCNDLADDLETGNALTLEPLEP